jgi:gliding motility-associated-like protein
LRKNVLYKFNIALAWGKPYLFNCGGLNSSVVVLGQVWGGNSSCTASKLLWESDSIKTPNTWENFSAQFKPDTNYTYLVLKTVSVGPLPYGPWGGYLLIDAMSNIEEVKPETWFTSPSQNSTQTCAFNITGKTDSLATSIKLKGKFTGDSVAAVLNAADTSWQASVTYPLGFIGKDTIVATGTFANNFVARDTLIVNIQPPPRAGFTVSNKCQTDSIIFTDTSHVTGNITQGNWYFGDSSISANYASTIKHFYKSAGVYDVSLKINTDAGCADSVSKQVSIINCDTVIHTIIIPSLITPNADGRNDFFEIKNLPENSKLEIFNIWGEKIFESENYKNNWAGENNRDGIYYYHLQSTSGEQWKGWVQVTGLNR